MSNLDFEYLLQLNMYRQLPLGGEGSIGESLENEKTYLEVIQQYANNEGFLKESVDLIRSDDIFEDIKLEICFIVLCSNDEALIDEVLEVVCSDSMFLPINEKISLMEEDKQKQIIKHLLEIDNKKSLSYAGKCIVANGYREFVSDYSHSGEIKQSYDPSVSYAVLCRLGNDDEKSLVEENFKDSSYLVLKEHIAVELIFANSSPALEYIKQLNSMDVFMLSPFILKYEDAYLYKKKLLEEIESQDEVYLDSFLGYFHQVMIWYGNPSMIPILIEMLQIHNVCLKSHEILLDFFDEDEPYIEEGHVIMEEWAEFEEELEDKYADCEEGDCDERYDIESDYESLKVQKKIIGFWEDRKEYISSEIIKTQRYYYDTPYSLSEVWEDTFDEGLKEHISLVHKGMQLLTGQFLEFDTDALVSKQIQQHKRMMDFLHKKLFSVGSWKF